MVCLSVLLVKAVQTTIPYIKDTLISENNKIICAHANSINSNADISKIITRDYVNIINDDADPNDIIFLDNYQHAPFIIIYKINKKIGIRMLACSEANYIDSALAMTIFNKLILAYHKKSLSLEQVTKMESYNKELEILDDELDDETKGMQYFYDKLGGQMLLVVIALLNGKKVEELKFYKIKNVTYKERETTYTYKRISVRYADCGNYCQFILCVNGTYDNHSYYGAQTDLKNLYKSLKSLNH